MSYTIFKTGQYKYPSIGKPVLFDDNFLKSISEKHENVNLNSVDDNNRHTDNCIGKVEGLYFDEGVLKANNVAGTFDEDTKFSPTFNCNLIDNGDFYLAVDGMLDHIAATNNPNQIVLNNSKVITDYSGADVMENEDKMAEIISKKDQEIGDLRNKLEATKKKLDSYDKFDKTSKDYEDQLESLNQQLEAAQNELKGLEDIKDKAKQFDENIEKQKQSLINDIVGEDPEMKEMLSKFSVEELTLMKDKKIINEAPKGKIYDGNTPDGSDNPHKQEKEFTKETYNKILEELGVDEPYFDF